MTSLRSRARPWLPEGSCRCVHSLPQQQLSERHFRSIAEVIEARVGIQLPASKRTMVEGRLRKRVRASASKPWTITAAISSMRGGSPRNSCISSIA